MTKEELHDKWDLGKSPYIRSATLYVMDEYAKQEAINFYKWALFESGYQITDDGIIDESQENEIRHINYEQLYDLYLKSK